MEIGQSSLQAMENKRRKFIILSATIAITVCNVALSEFFEEEENCSDETIRKKRKSELNFMSNNDLFQSRSKPELPLEQRINIQDVLKDPGRSYCKVLTSLYGWEFFTLADQLTPLIKTSRSNLKRKMGNRMKFNVYDRLYFTLFWLATGLEYYQMEFLFGWGKTTWEIEIQHVLECIIKGLDAWLQWPSAEERRLMAAQFDGVFRGCVGIVDAMEHPICKPKNRGFEQSTYSAKAGTNTLKTLGVIDRRGRFRFVQTGTPGGTNDRDQFTSSVLYLNKEQYFEGDQFLAADGIYRGDGPVLVSFNAAQLSKDNDGRMGDFNTTFTEYRKGVENSFGRVQTWFPLLGNKKYKWNLNHYTLCLAIHASVRLHNWLLHTRDLNYDPSRDPSYIFSPFW